MEKKQIRPELTETLLRRLYTEEGKSATEIMLETGWSRSTILIKLGRYGLIDTESPQKEHQTKAELPQRTVQKGTPSELPSEEELCELYEKNKMSVARIAEKYNISYNVVLRKLKKCGVEFRQNRNFSELLTEEKLRDLYIKKKMSSKQIAKEFNIGHTTVLNYLRKYNIDRRNKVDAMAFSLTAKNGLVDYEDRTEPNTAQTSLATSSDQTTDGRNIFIDNETLKKLDAYCMLSGMERTEVVKRGLNILFGKIVFE